MTKPAVIGLDLGGTKLAAAIFTSQGKILCRNAVPLAGRQGRAVGKLIRDELKSLLAAARARHLQITAASLSVPGIGYSKTGKVWAPNIPGWEHYPLHRELTAAVLDQHIRLAIDSNRACYILGETWRGAAKGCRNAGFLTVGTGITRAASSTGGRAKSKFLSYSAPATRSPTCEVVKPILPAARLFTFSRVILMTASSMALAALVSPRKSSII